MRVAESERQEEAVALCYTALLAVLTVANDVDVQLDPVKITIATEEKVCAPPRSFASC